MKKDTFGWDKRNLGISGLTVFKIQEIQNKINSMSEYDSIAFIPMHAFGIEYSGGSTLIPLIDFHGNRLYDGFIYYLKRPEMPELTLKDFDVN